MMGTPEGLELTQTEENAPPTERPADVRLAKRRLVELPSGAWAAVRRGTGADIERASLISGMGDGQRKNKSPMTMFMALAALKCLFADAKEGPWREVTYEELRDSFEDMDVMSVIGEVQTASGKPSQPST